MIAAIYYVLALGFSLVAIALAGIAAHRNLIVVMLGIEIILAASTIVLVSFISGIQNPDPSGIMMLFAIWAVASAEIITVIALYIYMKSSDRSFDISKLSKMKW